MKSRKFRDTVVLSIVGILAGVSWWYHPKPMIMGLTCYILIMVTLSKNNNDNE